MLIFDASDNSFTNGPELPNEGGLVKGACTIFNSAMHQNRPVVLAMGLAYEDGIVTKAQLLDYTRGNTWEGSKHNFRLINTTQPELIL